MRALLPLALLFAAALSGGCASPARLTSEVGSFVPYPMAYRHIVIPFDLNLDATSHSLRDESLRGGLKSVRYNVEVRWDTIAVADIAKAHGIETVHYADLEIISVLGVWKQEILHIYGR